MKKSLTIVAVLLVTGIVCVVLGVAINSRWPISYANEQGTKTFDVVDIDSVVSDDVATITIVQGDKEGMIATGNKVLLKDITAEVENHVLTIRQRRNFSFKIFSFGADSNTMSYTLYVKSLKSIDNEGVGTIESSALNAGDLRIRNEGVGTIWLKDLDAKNVDVNLTGTGSIELEGSTDALTGELTGVGSLEAFKLLSKTCDITIRGVGSAEVNCSATLKGEVQGVGSIDYKGSPQQVSKQVSGLGSISAE